ncbi:heterokaryon incompatibility protein-domain-containing protein, partial [Boeremia exigua]|uniref:heterokaryon incompatibility protein-domain-containing protein n=1 Tax=Boeremia exigua TaxID=749465 RepID=UPI001E8D38BA
IDWDLVKSWVGQCYATHERYDCRPVELSLRDVCVIDCVSRSVVPLPRGCEYAALSYVWGISTTSDLPLLDNRLPSPAPQVVDDAMYCAQQLGFLYLWVDRYCIDQNSESKHLLIQNMDRIYGCASITIVNASGDSSYHGLPGVSNVPRKQQQYITVNGSSIVRVRSCRKEIQQSKWASRGWTFQEGLLSTRRLVFTPSQVYFQCRVWHCCESISGVFNSSTDERREAVISLASSQQALTVHRGFGQKMFEELLSQYLRRQLTFDTDILLAFLAVIKSCSFQHCWGAPVRVSYSNSSGNELMQRLRWQPVGEIEANHLIRREGIPSWSWAAWQGLKGLRLGDIFEYTSGGDYKEMNIAIEEISGERRSISEYCSRFQPFLNIDGWITMIRFCPRNSPLRKDWNATTNLLVFEHTGRLIVGSAFVMNIILPEEPEWDGSQLLSGTWPVLVFFETRHAFDAGTEAVNVRGLVLRPCKDSTYQRLGVL